MVPVFDDHDADFCWNLAAILNFRHIGSPENKMNIIFGLASVDNLYLDILH